MMNLSMLRLSALQLSMFNTAMLAESLREPAVLEQQEIQKTENVPEVPYNHIVLADLNKTYANGVKALKDINLTIQRGEIFGIIGRSGAGKSSLIRTLNRLENPSSGTVAVNGVNIGALNENELVAFRRRTGMIFQHFNLLSAKTVRENIELPLKVAGVSAAARKLKVDSLLKLVGLEARHNAYPAQLSGGQKQRVGIARALVHDPEILLCDEATSALDPETTHSILALLKSINQTLKLTIVLITHEMEVIREICDRVVVLENGEMIESGDVWQVFGEPQHEVTQTLLTPTRQSLPENIQAQLHPHPKSARDSLLLRLSYSGFEASRPNLSALVKALGHDVQIISSSLDVIQQRTVGSVLLTAIPQFGATALINKAQKVAIRVEALGYVYSA
ncbi:methionine ABC transporter ATP-binding protein [Hafnia alvei]|uniref:methionine ABC transporter ATP-binding protein n=1 Tax=Hafnia alvei TaxID=569 RepID=UPI000E0783AB|nr:ATP-binding cassette domain-containing protein [Hafnia alvei]STQ71015.1 Methionine import ATP-binding protein MetN [Hafnia alvei]